MADARHRHPPPGTIITILTRHARHAEVFWTCTTHALSTEREEVMGLLLGDVLARSLTLIRYADTVRQPAGLGHICEPSVVHVVHLWLQFAEDGTSVARIWVAVPQIRTDRRKVGAANYAPWRKSHRRQLLMSRGGKAVGCAWRAGSGGGQSRADGAMLRRSRALLKVYWRAHAHHWVVPQPSSHHSPPIARRCAHTGEHAGSLFLSAYLRTLESKLLYNLCAL